MPYHIVWHEAQAFRILQKTNAINLIMNDINNNNWAHISVMLHCPSISYNTPLDMTLLCFFMHNIIHWRDFFVTKNCITCEVRACFIALISEHHLWYLWFVCLPANIICDCVGVRPCVACGLSRKKGTSTISISSDERVFHNIPETAALWLINSSGHQHTHTPHTLTIQYSWINTKEGLGY